MWLISTGGGTWLVEAACEDDMRPLVESRDLKMTYLNVKGGSNLCRKLLRVSRTESRKMSILPLFRIAGCGLFQLVMTGDLK